MYSLFAISVVDIYYAKQSKTKQKNHPKNCMCGFGEKAVSIVVAASINACAMGNC